MTVIIPAYNCNATLGRTLKSLTEQSVKDFKVLIVDDCSTQNLYEVIEKYTLSLNITVVKTSCNQGCGGARQKGIETIGTDDDYIIFVDADDILLSNAIEVLQTATIDEPDIIITPFLIQDLMGNIKTYNYRTRGSGTFMTHGKAYNTKFLQQHNIYSPIEIRYFFNDWFLNHLALNCTTNINILPTPIALYIKTPNSATTKEDNKEKYMNEMRNLSYKILADELRNRGLQRELLYWENEKRLLALVREQRGPQIQAIKELQNKYKI